MSDRPLYIPVLLGTVRKGRMSRFAAKAVLNETAQLAGVETELIDICSLPLPIDDAGESIKDPGFSQKMTRADALVVVSPEYNHGYSGMLKHVLDSCLKEYVHKAVGIVGVSASAFGGSRGIEDLIPVMRELGLVTIFWDVNFGNVQKVFDSDGKLLDETFIPRIQKFLDELVWMARSLRYGRESIGVKREVSAMTCQDCDAKMNHHADKLLYTDVGDQMEECYQCPNCGAAASRRAA
jgi:NAD(P)H-dependent FMN reductase